MTGAIFAALWVGAWLVYSISYWLTLAISVLAAALLVRLFMIQHDCGHGAFFRRRVINDWVGRIIGVLTLTPYAVWRRSHSTHHATSSNLGKRGIGDIDTLTVREYQALPRGRRLAYRLYRTPLVIFVVGPAFQFLLRNRLPQGIRREDWGNWVSAMGTNIMIILAAGLMIYAIGPEPFLLVHLPIILLASSIGVWLFYVQHQYEDTYWAAGDEWDYTTAAIEGSSFYKLPKVLQWFSGNIGFHHIHHLSSRIPNYNLERCHNSHPMFHDVKPLLPMASLKCMHYRLWDQENKRLITFHTYKEQLRDKEQLKAAA